eukprot:7238497-Pyramimonas_sp.AAC.1
MSRRAGKPAAPEPGRRPRSGAGCPGGPAADRARCRQEGCIEPTGPTTSRVHPAHGTSRCCRRNSSGIAP